MKRRRKVITVIAALIGTGFLIALGSMGALELCMIGFKRFFLQESAGLALMAVGAFVAKVYEPIL